VILIRAWLDLPIGAVFLVLAACLAVATAAVHWLSFGRITRPWALRHVGVVAPYAGVLAVLFSLLTSFLANDVWERERQAERAVLVERDGLLTAHELIAATAADMAGLREALRRYVRVVVAEEWPLMAEGGRSAAADDAIDALLREVAKSGVAAAVGQAAHGALLGSLLQVRRARDDRLLLSGDQADQTKWAAVLILALLTLVAIGIVHLERPRAQLAALVVFAVAVAATLGLVATRERPFAGAERISPAPLAEVLTDLTAEGDG
jgi:hypothetical protein